MANPQARAALKGTGLKPVRIKQTVHYMRRFGFSPDIVVDVGVYDGTGWLYRAFEGAQFLLIDPLSESAELVAPIAPPGHEFLAVALGSEDGEMDLTVTHKANGGGGNLSGFHRRVDGSRNWSSWTEQRRVPVRRLDEIMADRPGSVGLKIDTEGHEAEVLDGAGETLRRCVFVVAEVSVSRRFAETPLPSALIARLAEAGLELRDVLAMAPPDHDMPRHMDMLFTRWPQQEGIAA
ncbi:FkbM family methyltransferase [Frigidibacter sp. ROC022]|uniref:FkbM family methyltransferase n=1 Tax=Frigidibacter sp. ROC022 TaxID=2971796 RepID=UPI00215B1204|nr:FkbM family methyltransferase [Frigidibacter sp. ROC022]MCR8724050.1 FkbM family methyltransferase [Frigidibacter sp. ROC022]